MCARGRIEVLDRARLEPGACAMRIFRDFEELKAAVGTEIGESDWVQITQDRISTFAEATGDEQWIHVDEERAARELPGKSTIAHGLLTLSLIPMFMRMIVGLKGLKNTLNYGANRIRYLSPVPAGSRLRARVAVMQAEDVPPDALRVTYKVTIEIEGGKRPACVAEVIGQHYR
jgi:acyl dehydratase